MLESFRKGQRWLTLIFVSVIGLVFVFFLGVGGSFGPSTPTGNTVVELDDVVLTTRDFAREKYNTETRLRQQLGDSYEQLGADRYVDSQALGSMVNAVVLEAAARDMGLEVTQDELRRVVQANPNFIDEEGRFSPAAFENFAEYEYGTQRSFIQHFRRGLLAQKLVSLISDQVGLSDAELDLRTRYELEQVRLAYVTISTTTLPPDESLEDTEIEAYAEAHEDELRREYELQAAYAGADAENRNEPDRIRARHILFAVTETAPEEDAEEALARAEAARERIVGGEDFELVASEVSDDSRSAEKGGELGVLAPGAHDAAFDEVAFALETGEVSEIVRTIHGYHLIRVDERIVAEAPSFESRRFALAREQATRTAAAKRAKIISEAISNEIESGKTLEDAARAQGFDVTRTPALKRRPDGLIPGLGAAEELLTTAFTLEEGESSATVFEVGDQRVLISVVAHDEPDMETLIAERSSRRDRARSEKQNRILQTWINDYRAQLEASGRLRVNPEIVLGS